MIYDSKWGEIGKDESKFSPKEHSNGGK